MSTGMVISSCMVQGELCSLGECQKLCRRLICFRNEHGQCMCGDEEASAPLQIQDLKPNLCTQRKCQEQCKGLPCTQGQHGKCVCGDSILRYESSTAAPQGFGNVGINAHQCVTNNDCQKMCPPKCKSKFCSEGLCLCLQCS